eukprot:232214-Hanusia_phi.AAC.5
MAVKHASFCNGASGKLNHSKRRGKICSMTQISHLLSLGHIAPLWRSWHASGSGGNRALDNPSAILRCQSMQRKHLACVQVTKPP